MIRILISFAAIFSVSANAELAAVQIRDLQCEANNGVSITTTLPVSASNNYAVVESRWGLMVKHFQASVNLTGDGQSYILLASDYANYVIQTEIDLKSKSAQNIKGVLVNVDAPTWNTGIECRVQLD